MSSYASLSSTVDQIVIQAIIAEMRCYASNYVWRVDDEESPDSVWVLPSHGMGSNVNVTIDWGTGVVIDDSSTGPGTEDTAANLSKLFRFWKAKWEGRIPPLFDKFLEMPEPDKFRSEADGLDMTGKLLNGGGFKIGDTEFEGSNLDYYLWQVGTERAKLNDWNGAAAKAFRDKFLKTWPRNLSNQFAALCLMKLCMEREKKMWEKSREQIALTADHAVSAMKGADGPEPDNSVGLAIFSAVAGVVSVGVPVAGQVGLAAITGALAIADAASQEPEKKTMEFGADTPDGVYDKLKSGLDDFDSEIWDAEYVVYDHLSDLQSALVTREPFIGTGAGDLAGTTDPDDVALVGDIIEVGEVDNLRTVADICIHASADARTAATNLTIADPSGTRARNGMLGLGPDGAADKYANCSTLLQDIIADNGLLVGDCGENLDAAANTYLTTDTDSERTMQDHSGELAKARKDDGDMPHPPPVPRHLHPHLGRGPQIPV